MNIVTKAFMLGGLSFASIASAVPQFVPGEMIVKFKSHITKSFKADLEENGLNISRPLTDGGQLYLVKSSQKGITLSMIQNLQSLDEVEYAEPNYIYSIVKPIKNTLKDI